MKVKTFDSTVERQVLVAMVTNDRVLARIATKWNDGMFSSSYSNLIAKWCIKFYTKHSKAPNRAIETIFAAWSEKSQDSSTVSLVESFLSSLSNDYEREIEINSDHIIDVAAEYFNQVRLEKGIQQAQGYLELGDTKEAARIMREASTPIEMGIKSRINLFQDESAIKNIYTESPQPLIVYPGEAGRFFQDQLTRDSLVSFVGPEKVGKSFWLMDVAYMALTQRRRVAFFEVGDMTEKQIKQRFLSRIAKHPYRSTNPDGRWPCTVKVPTKITPIEGEFVPDVEFSERKFEYPVDENMAIKACQDFNQRYLKSKNPYFYLSIHPNSSISVNGIKTTLKEWEQEDGWTPDVIVIDYADILAPPISGKYDTRDEINATWKLLSAMRLELHCLIVTATQADAASYTKTTIDRTNFSEDKRKNAHVTGMIGINMKWDEKEKQVCRLNWIEVREMDFSSLRCLTVGQCLPLANPCVKSVYYGH